MAFFFFLLLPYRTLWTTPLVANAQRIHRAITTLMAVICWYALVTGHLLNNIKGVGF